jgi:hypothetical protein
MLASKQYFSDGFPRDPHEVLDFIDESIFTEYLGPKEEWLEWLSLASQENIDEFVNTVHDLWIEKNQKDESATPKVEEVKSAPLATPAPKAEVKPTPQVEEEAEVAVEEAVTEVEAEVEEVAPEPKPIPAPAKVEIKREDPRVERTDRPTPQSQPRQEPRQEPKQESRSESRNDSRNEAKNDSRNDSRDNRDRNNNSRNDRTNNSTQVRSAGLDNQVAQSTPKTQHSPARVQDEDEKSISLQDETKMIYKSFDIKKVRETATKNELDGVYKKYLDSKESYAQTEQTYFESQSALFDKMMGIVVNFEQVADYFESMTEKLLEMNDKIITQGRELQTVKTSLIAKNQDLEDKVQLQDSDIQRLERDLRDTKSLNSRRYQELAELTSRINNDSFGDEVTMKQRLDLIDAKIAKLNNQLNASKIASLSSMAKEETSKKKSSNQEK